MRISASEQVARWLLALPPDAKKKARMALRQLSRGRGDIKALQGPLEGFNRLRIGGRRILYRQISATEIVLEYASTRDVVYELFQQILSRRQGSPREE